MHPHLTQRAADTHRDDLHREADHYRLVALARRTHQRERLATRLLDALADSTRPRGTRRCTADA